MKNMFFKSPSPKILNFFSAPFPPFIYFWIPISMPISSFVSLPPFSCPSWFASPFSAGLLAGMGCVPSSMYAPEWKTALHTTPFCSLIYTLIPFLCLWISHSCTLLLLYDWYNYSLLLVQGNSVLSYSSHLRLSSLTQVKFTPIVDRTGAKHCIQLYVNKLE